MNIFSGNRCSRLVRKTPQLGTLVNNFIKVETIILLQLNMGFLGFNFKINVQNLVK